MGKQLILPNNVANSLPSISMTSQEIADMTGKSHFHVMRDIKELLTELAVSESNFGFTYEDAQGKKRPAYKLPKRELLTLISGYSAKIRVRIIDRLEELETEARTGKSPALPNLKNAIIAANKGAKFGHLTVKILSDENIYTAAAAIRELAAGLSGVNKERGIRGLLRQVKSYRVGMQQSDNLDVVDNLIVSECLKDLEHELAVFLGRSRGQQGTKRSRKPKKHKTMIENVSLGDF
jgi:phage regulator Rha-like protein